LPPQAVSDAIATMVIRMRQPARERNRKSIMR
jgi:hypothetical protein